MPDANASAATAWRLCGRIELTWHEWPGEGCAAFESASGQIIELDELASAVMACIESGPVSTDQIADVLAADLGLAADDEFRGAVEQIVEQFHLLGWVDPIIAA